MTHVGKKIRFQASGVFGDFLGLRQLLLGLFLRADIDKGADHSARRAVAALERLDRVQGRMALAIGVREQDFRVQRATAADRLFGNLLKLATLIFRQDAAFQHRLAEQLVRANAECSGKCPVITEIAPFGILEKHRVGHGIDQHPQQLQLVVERMLRQLARANILDRCHHHLALIVLRQEQHDLDIEQRAIAAQIAALQHHWLAAGQQFGR